MQMVGALLGLVQQIVVRGYELGWTGGTGWEGRASHQHRGRLVWEQDSGENWMEWRFGLG